MPSFELKAKGNDLPDPTLGGGANPLGGSANPLGGANIGKANGTAPP
jgi:hypothetical protein